MLKTTGSFDDLASKIFRADGNKVVKDGGSRVNKTVKNLSKSKKSKNKKSEILTRFSDIGAMGKPIFLILGASEALNHLKQAFIKAPILQHFNPECHIWIETNASGYAIGEVPSQLSTD